jgi:hypothetical protein
LISGRLPSEFHAIQSDAESNVQTFDKRWICRQSLVNLNGYGLRARGTRERAVNCTESAVLRSEILDLLP